MANLSSWSENDEQAILSFEQSLFKNRAGIAKTICSTKQTFYIHRKLSKIYSFRQKHCTNKRR
jgi:hypothetical protein